MGLNSCLSSMLPHIDIPRLVNVNRIITAFAGFNTMTLATDLKTDCKMFLWLNLLGLKFLCLIQMSDPLRRSSILLWSRLNQATNHVA